MVPNNKYLDVSLTYTFGDVVISVFKTYIIDVTNVEENQQK